MWIKQDGTLFYSKVSIPLFKNVYSTHIRQVVPERLFEMPQV